MLKAFALYRLPHETESRLIVQEDGEPLALDGLDGLDSVRGFVMAPFHTSAEEPVVVIRGKTVTYRSREIALPECHPGPEPAEMEEGRERYAADFRRFHEALSEGRFRKLVLARRKSIPGGGTAEAEALFNEACRRYPRMMIALVSTPQSGTWLMATPETLLRGIGKEWHTVALAGTMPLTEEQLASFDQPIGNPGTAPEWSAKNRAEQQVVADYLDERLRLFSNRVEQQPVRTVRAGHLAHLRSDFTFRLSRPDRLGALLEGLHPTPAVCGLPKEEARDFIRRNESAPRHYYSGFMGPLGMEEGTHLYVSLRCMRLLPDRCVLYAGGGLLPESRAENEWRETEQKMKTMLQCIAASQT